MTERHKMCSIGWDPQSQESLWLSWESCVLLYHKHPSIQTSRYGMWANNSPVTSHLSSYLRYIDYKLFCHHALIKRQHFCGITANHVIGHSTEVNSPSRRPMSMAFSVNTGLHLLLMSTLDTPV